MPAPAARVRPRARPRPRWPRPRARRRGLSMMGSIRQPRVKPSAGRRFRVARKPRVLGGRLLAERHHECAVGVVVGARPLLHHGLREAEGLRTDRPALRVARQHDRLAAREADLDGPGLDISRRLDTQANRVRRLADGGRERGGRGGGAGIAGAPPPGDVKRTSSRNAPATRTMRQVAVSGTRGSVGGRRARGRATIRLRRAMRPPHGLAVP